MSGSDPSVRTGGNPGGPDGCPEDFETVLASPDPAVVADLTAAELLDIVPIDTPIRGVVAQRLTGEYVGAVTRDIARLRRCIENGEAYEAEVRRVVGGSVSIIVRRRR